MDRTMKCHTLYISLSLVGFVAELNLKVWRQPATLLGLFFGCWFLTYNTEQACNHNWYIVHDDDCYNDLFLKGGFFL
jgi:hypothetical protein